MLTHTIRYDRHGTPHPLEGAAALVAALRRHSGRDGFVWLEAWEPDEAEMAQLATLLGLDPRSAAEASAIIDRHTADSWPPDMRALLLELLGPTPPPPPPDAGQGGQQG